MKKGLLYCGLTLLLIGGGLAAFAALQEPTSLPKTRLADMDLGALTRDEMLKKLDYWWAGKRLTVIQPRSDLITRQPAAMSLADLGIAPDWDATLRTVKFEGYAQSLFPGEKDGGEIDVAYKIAPVALEGLKKFVKAHGLPSRPARVLFRSGAIVREHEVTTFQIDEARLPEVALAAAQERQSTFEIPMVESPAKISREALDSITDVVSEFTTRFNAGQLNRSSNIRVATASFDGQILMPGETLSYNQTVGPRLVSRGFKLAGVYRNGRHDTGIGGGICQVSTTLFNAAALADLGIVSRSNHSMPVPYVPVGRDATVDYGSIDLKIRNTYSTPIAISSETVGATVTFRILGKKTPGLSVELSTSDHSSWANTLKTVVDPSLPAGKTKVVEKGSIGRKCVTWRTVKQDGQVIKRERLGQSLYRASPRIVATGPAAKPSANQPDSEPPPVDDIG